MGSDDGDLRRALVPRPGFRWRKELDISINKCSVPSWQAGAKGDHLDVPLLIKIFEGAVPKLVRSHNEIHDRLER